MKYIVTYKTTAPKTFDTEEEASREYNSRLDVVSIGPAGQKFSNYKLDMDKLFIQFPHACQAVVLASTFGNAKYQETDNPDTWDNFKHVPNGYKAFKSAEKRHDLLKTEEEEESGLHPEFHILWNSSARYERWALENKVNESKLAEKHIKEWYERFK